MWQKAQYNGNLSENHHIRITIQGNSPATATVYMRGRGYTAINDLPFDSNYDGGALTNIGARVVKIAVFNGNAAAQVNIKNLTISPLISGTSYQDNSATDKAAPTVPTKGGSDPIDGSPSHNTGDLNWSGIHNIDIEWNASTDNGTTYYY